ncbi:MAG: FHA domain-containing protein [Deltaproteobacteria bacterium]|jgi:hypothetical protein|nr:FHA domain-containing protein [Deltaproteobacteria bacterium]MBW2534641.1 FHA domain-containing protein [Deltaproteobacteria bacterium]
MDTPVTDRRATRFIELSQGRPGRRRNWATMLPTGNEALSPSYFQLCFAIHYQQIRALCTAYDVPGVAVVVVGKAGVMATGWLGCKTGTINSAILGRHHAADLCLVEDATLSLRHLALLTYPLRGGRDVRYRLVDLRTPAAFADERGHKLGCLDAEGPAFVACGHYCLFFFTTGDGLPWPQDAVSGWQCIPERIYFDDQAAEPDRWLRPHFECPGDPHSSGRRTTIRTAGPPVRVTRHLLCDQDQPLGRLQIRSALGAETIVIGAAAADRGVLLGRYERCDVDGVSSLGHPRISRVHCLLIRIDGILYAVDTASTNGLGASPSHTLLEGMRPGRLRFVPLDSEQWLDLAGGAAHLGWQPLQ